MITTTTASNTVILSDLIKGQFAEAHGLYDWHIERLNEVLEENSQERLIQVIAGRRFVTNKMMSITLISCYFMESLINSYGYYKLEQTSNEILKDFEQFVNLSTVAKWKQFLKDEALGSELKDLFEYRNFIVHSKPVRTENGVSEVYKKYKGWVPVSSISTYLIEQSSWGLIQNPMSLENLSRVLSLVNSLVASLDKEFIKHYHLSLDDQAYLSEYKSYIQTVDRLTEEHTKKYPVDLSIFEGLK